MEIRPGIHQVPGLRWSNAFLLVEDHRLTLIDAGLPGNGRHILRYIHHLGRDPSDLHQIVLTHSHPDHTGPIKQLSQLTGATIAVHAGDTRKQPDTGERRLHYPGQPPALGWNVPFLRRIPAHETLEDGQVLPVFGGLHVLHTPGHTPGSVCLHLPDQGVLFTGDMLLANGHRFRRPVYFPGTNLQDYRDSVQRLSQVSFETACVGHGSPLLEGGTERLQEMLDHYSWMSPRWSELKRWARLLVGR
ncbi:MAG: MBL fold metallo-hydrolase [Chloroflexi bacterium]|nr:MBL fold metallo-hydrolase [Chloroflexota bacterium]